MRTSYFGNFGDVIAIAAAERALATATAAMAAPTCVQGPVANLPAVVCNPALAAATELAANRLKELKGAGGSKSLIIGGVVAVAVIGGFLFWRSKKR